ncbi:MAG: transcription-repair coupling factor, partial [Anaerovoracaceae bacterium]
ASKKIYVLPGDEEKLVNYEAKNRDTMLARLKVMNALQSGEDCIVVASVSAVMKKIIPKGVFRQDGLSITVGEEGSLLKFIQKLAELGYERVPMVYASGQFAVRGGILDVFTPYLDLPVRIDFFDTEVEEIRSFDPETQRSVEKLNRLDLYRAELLVYHEEVFAKAQKKIVKAYQHLEERRDQLLEAMESLMNLQQLENYLDYFYEKPEHIWDYLEENSVVILDDPGRSQERVTARDNEFKLDFELLLEQEKVVAPEIKAHLWEKEFLKLYGLPKVFFCTPFPKAIKGVEAYEEIRQVQSRQTLSYNGKMDMLEKELKKYIEHHYKVTLVCSTQDRYDNLKDFLNRCDLGGRVWVAKGSLTSGMEFPEEKICYITDGDIFGTYKKNTRRSKSKAKGGTPIKTFADIRKGDFVVHERHGIGKFLGLEQLTIQGEKKDYLKIKYGGKDALYIPVEQMDVIQKYVGGDSEKAKLSKFGGSEWKNTKAKAKASIANMAKELLEISAARNARIGHRFDVDTVWQKEFEDSFPYEETSDQLRCIEEIKADMESERAMDRLLCGDVGYGKTEVAARAMFKCAAEGKQVAVLVPTTVLANQHYYTLKERFEAFPFKVEMLSRFRSEKEQKNTIEKMKNGSVDVIIGTHRLLSSDIEFKDLGLLVIDEEQRFGVAHKEKIKKLRQNVDVLTLSATPIPRTLHMSLVGIRDMSVIEEPPEERYPVQTYVLEEDDFVLKEAIERELDRGGQVYIIYNRVSGVHKIAKHIDTLVPGRRIVVGHGRMAEGSLEDVMMEVMDGEADILVATTIIESGIDIPNVNTIIVIDSDRFGLSQLYQLRGRVGRSTRMAYAYLTHKPNKVLSEVAEKRLRAIKEFTEFGAGFKISMRDLEIRGAGNLLGSEQHGHMVNVGYELYCKLVDDAVKALKGEVVEEKTEATVLVNVPAYIPERYIEDEILKLTIYKKIAGITGEEEKNELLEELADRFGEIPTEVTNLILVSWIKGMAEALSIEKISQRGAKIILDYGKNSETRPITLFATRGKGILEDISEILMGMLQKNVVQ